jgi:hypothetical protein
MISPPAAAMMDDGVGSVPQPRPSLPAQPASSIMSLTTHPLTLRLANWIAREPPASQREVLLDRRRVYILPTRAGLAFGLVLLALLIGAINYELQLGFLLTFLVAGVAIAGMHHTHRNLARLTLRAHHAENVFAGDAASFHLAIANPTREALERNLAALEAQNADLLAALAKATTLAQVRAAAQAAAAD